MHIFVGSYMNVARKVGSSEWYVEKSDWVNEVLVRYGNKVWIVRGQRCNQYGCCVNVRRMIRGHAGKEEMSCSESMRKRTTRVWKRPTRP